VQYMVWLVGMAYEWLGYLVDYLDYVFNYHYNYTTGSYERRIGLDYVQRPWKWFKIMGFLMAYTLLFDHFVNRFMMRRPSIISSIFGGHSDGFSYVWVAGHGDGSDNCAMLAGGFHAGCRCG